MLQEICQKVLTFYFGTFSSRTFTKESEGMSTEPAVNNDGKQQLKNTLKSCHHTHGTSSATSDTRRDSEVRNIMNQMIRDAFCNDDE